MAAQLKQELNVDADLIIGDAGEFTVWVNDQIVAKKGLFFFPDEKKVVEAVRHALNES